MSNVKTSWEDLANLGWPKNDVYRKANAQRGGTMEGQGDIALNERFAVDWHWYSYNSTIGSPYPLGRVPTSHSEEQVAWSYDNTQNTEVHEEKWKEVWTNSTTATLSMSSSVTISLSSTVTVMNVASAGFSLSLELGKETTKTETQSKELTRKFTMRVNPGEKLSLVRVISKTSEVAEYGQDYGLANNSRVATKGRKYNDHYYWGYDLNWLLNRPKGTLRLQGVSESVKYDFKIVREGPKGVTVQPLVAQDEGSDDAAEVPAAEYGSLSEVMVPGKE